jgi:hypothetical protein
VEVSLKQAPQTGGANLQAEIVVDKLSDKGKSAKKIYSLSAQHYVAK